MAEEPSLEIVRGTLSREVALELENARLRKQLEELQAERVLLEIYRNDSLVDVLTRLPNRKLLESRLAEEISRKNRLGAAVSLVVVDIDGFHDVNLAHGHVKGDELLLSIAAILRKELRTYDVCARLGADRFAAVLPDAGELACAQIVARLRAALPPNVTVGWATATPASVAESLLTEAQADLDTARKRPELTPTDVVEEAIGTIDTVLCER